MGLFGGLFGGPFDFNRDGKTDAFEMGLAFSAMEAASEEETAELEDERLNQTGFETSELELMDPQERREILEDSGLDPEDFDFGDDW
jgi:hypothetical protein